MAGWTFQRRGWQPDVFGGSFNVIGISLETHSFLFCKFYGSVKEKNTMSGSNKPEHGIYSYFIY